MSWRTASTRTPKRFPTPQPTITVEVPQRDENGDKKDGDKRDEEHKDDGGDGHNSGDGRDDGHRN